MSKIVLTASIPEEMSGLRLDQALARLFPQFSRAQHQHWVRQGLVTVDQKTPKTRDIVQFDQTVLINAELETQTSAIAQAIPLDISYEDENILIIDKPAGLIAHPGAGNPDRTLVNALLHHDPKLEALPRAGLIHRLDKDTSGLLVIARDLESYTVLNQAMQAREIKREYQAVVQGLLISGGTVEAPIGRHPRVRSKMAVNPSGKEAVTHYRIIEKFRGHTHLRIELETGRTHQIRVHLSHRGYPVVGDSLYLKQIKLPKEMDPAAKDYVKSFRRQALHAAKLELLHPKSAKLLSVTSNLPADIAELIQVLKNDNDHKSL